VFDFAQLTPVPRAKMGEARCKFRLLNETLKVGEGRAPQNSNLCILHTYVIGSQTTLRAKPFQSRRIPFEAKVFHWGDGKIANVLTFVRYFWRSYPVKLFGTVRNARAAGDHAALR
jgi:hypothetical protein